MKKHLRRQHVLPRILSIACLAATGMSVAAAADADRVQAVAYYFPNWGPQARSEWSLVKAARPQFEGHAQPKKPLWGYADENDPAVMAQKIDAARAHGISAFIFDWYHFDPGSAERDQAGSPPWNGQKYLSHALESGFLRAANNDRLQFAIMWCNHDVGKARGAVQPATFDSIAAGVTKYYFTHPSYWKIDGRPYFSIYSVKEFLETYGNDLDAAAAALARFRDVVRAAGFSGLHLNAVLWGLPAGRHSEVISRLGFDSATTYVWIHHHGLPDFPATDYAKAAASYFHALEHGGGVNGLERPVRELPVPYHPNATMGWDSSPRCRNAADWASRRVYPFGPVIVNNTPAAFRGALERVKAVAAANPQGQRIVTLNAWNEWGEGSYLEPDTTHGLAYLEAVRDVFGPLP